MITITHAFTEIGTLWALAGLAAWLAFYKQLIPEARIRKIRGLVTEYVLDYPRTWWFVTGALGLFLFVTSFIGVLEIQNGAGPPRAVQLYRIGEKPSETRVKETVIPGQSYRRLCWVGWGGRSWNVKVDGMPERQVSVDPWWLASGSEKYVVPWSFARPVVLIAPDPFAAEKLGSIGPNTDFTIEVVITEGHGDDETESVFTTVGDYLGGLVWIGCEDTSVALPDGLANRRDWDRVLNQTDVLNRPSQVVGTRDEDTLTSTPVLKPGQRISARIKRGGLIVFKSDPLIVANVRPDGSFVQALLIEDQPDQP